MSLMVVERKARKRCADCVALVEGKDGAWVCDEANAPITDVRSCGEWEDDRGKL
jgi:hypothetical protein